MKKFLALYVFAILAVALGTTTSKAGTIAHWTFEEGVPGSVASGTETITDIVGGNHGTALNGPHYVDGAISGFGTKGLRLDGNSHTVRVASGSTGALALSNDFTIEIGMIANRPNSTGFGVFYGDSQGGRDPYFISFDNNGSVTFRIYGGASGTDTLTTAAGLINYGESAHIAAVFDLDEANGTDNMMNIYVDSLLVASLNAGDTTPFYGDTVSDFWIGSVHGAGRNFSGILTDVRISDMALTGEDMFPVPEPGAIAIFAVGLFLLGISRRRKA